MQTTSSSSAVDVLRREVIKHYELYPSARMSETTIPAWVEELHELPREVLASAFEEARRGSPEFPATAAQVKAIAEVKAAEWTRARAERRQERLLPEPANTPRNEIRQAFYGACDKLLATAGARGIDPADEPALKGAIVLMLRTFGCVDLPEDHPEYHVQNSNGWFAGIVVNDWRHRKFELNSCVLGLRRVPRYCRRPPTLWILNALVCGESLGGYSLELVAPEGDALA